MNRRKNILAAGISIFLAASTFAQNSDDDFFNDDEFFGEDTVEEYVETEKTDKALSHGTIFENGSVKIGGSFSTGLNLFVPLYDPDNDDFAENLKSTGLSPNASASISIDARPTQTLRMFSKFGVAYPYTASATALTTSNPYNGSYNTTVDVTSNLFVKELFSDFSIADTAFFRFGLHTVSWGTGFFFSPVSDMINTSSIDPENTDTQVDGSLNLRTQITFPDTQNCLWLYVIPSSKKILDTSNAASLMGKSLNSILNSLQYPYDARYTAFAAKGDIVLGGWELGAGGFYQYNNAPKLMMTASGTLFGKITVFGEAVYRYGSDTEWKTSSEWKDKTNIFQGTAGLSYYWKNPQITFAAQYYFDGNEDDNKFTTKGNNVAATMNFAKIGNIPNVSANLLGLFYINKDSMTLTNFITAAQSGIKSSPYAGIVSGTVNWNPVTSLTISAGPYLTWTNFDDAPMIAAKLGVSLGGGKF